MQKHGRTKLNLKRFTNYFAWGGILTFIESFWLDGISSFPVIYLIILNGIIGFSVEYWFGKFMYNDWYRSGSLINSTTCDCRVCRRWTKENIKSVIVTRMVLSILIIVPFVVNCRCILPKNINLSVQAKILEKRIKARGFNTVSFSIIALLDKELVKGKKGDYYKVDLNNSALKKKVLFPTGKYVIGKLDENLLIPMNSFTDSVYTILKEGFDCDLFVRGNADVLGKHSFQDVFVKGYGKKEGFSKFQVYPIEDEFYGRISTYRTIKEPFNNNDLPDLRGRFLQSIFEDHFQDLTTPSILEGKVTNSVSRLDRSGYLLMYVDWDSNNFSWFPKWIHQILLFLFNLFVVNLQFKLSKRIELKFSFNRD